MDSPISYSSSHIGYSEAKHYLSSSLEDHFSFLQKTRQEWCPVLPSLFNGPICSEEEYEEGDEWDSKVNGVSVDPEGIPSNHVNMPLQSTKLINNTRRSHSPNEAAMFKALFPHIYGKGFIQFTSSSSSTQTLQGPLRIGVVLSGGQAPGGHNVIVGIYDYIKRIDPHSQLYGFLGGPYGVYSHEYIEITEAIIMQYRNQGGFHMIRSGRHKIETEAQKEGSMKICKLLALHGLVIIGGDDSNTNAAILAEYFLSQNCETNIIGCPKTIDGDLRNEYIEASFGFDTAIKTYAEFIGNLCLDVATSGKYYHFVRLMGRSASHITLECAFQTRPNLALIGEEVLAKGVTLPDIVNEIAEMVIGRSKMGKEYGIILLPEGLIEFLPQIGSLIEEINSVVASGEFDASKLSEPKAILFEMLPSSIQKQLLLDRDPHGNVQVAMIATERLLILMVELELKARGFTGSFNPQAHYFGYEGRCGLPSNFDSNYGYALGYTSGALIRDGRTGYMARLSNLHQSSSEWVPGGCPLTKIMVIERRKGKDVPVIKKYLVDLNSPLFKLFVEVREEWKYHDLYKSPGSIQFDGPLADIANYSITSPAKEDAIPMKASNYEELKSRYHFIRLPNQLSPLENYRLSSLVNINPLLKHPNAIAIPGSKVSFYDSETQKAVLSHFPMQCRLSALSLYDIQLGTTESGLHGIKGIRIGVALTGQQAPGISNILWGLYERMRLCKGAVIGFKAGGLFNGDHIELTEEDISLCRNQAGFTLLGRQTDSESLIATTEGIDKIRKTCCDLLLDGLVMIGGRWALTDTCILAENFLQNNVKTKTVAIPATQNNNIDSQYLESTIGFDTASKCYSHLIGNLLTDAASATKYWYFIRLMGRDKSHMVLEASLQSHPNVALVSESYAAGDKTLEDVVSDIADTICARAEANKNFGAVVVPEGLFSELPQMRHLLHELNKLWARDDLENKQLIANDLISLSNTNSSYLKWMSPWSLALLKSLPEFIRKQIIQPRRVGRFQFSKISTEELLCKMVASELAVRKAAGTYRGSFSPVCFYLGYQARSSLPSQFDCAMGLSHGYLAAISILSGLTGYATSMRGLCAPSQQWIPVLFPVHTILRIQGDELYASKVPMVPSDTVKLDGKAFRKVNFAHSMWSNCDHFCNPGPIQFFGSAASFYNKYLFEQHYDYLEMLSEVSEHVNYLSKNVSFGVGPSTLRTACVTLRMLRDILSQSFIEETKFLPKKSEDGSLGYSTQSSFL